MPVEFSDLAPPPKSRSPAWLGDSEMASSVLEFDWSATPLGPLAGWPWSLTSAVAICLHSRFQMAIYWGPELNCIYNDAERDVLGKLHPGALGCPARDLLHDSWPVVGPQLEAVMRRGEATWGEDRPLMFDRRGSVELGFFTYSYSPIYDDRGEVGGVLLVSEDTTARVLAERRIEALRELATRSMDASTERQACRLAAHSLADLPDTPFALIYLFDDTGHAKCGGVSAESDGFTPAHTTVELDQGEAGAVLAALAKTPSRGMLVNAELFATPANGHRAIPRRAFAASILGGAGDSVAGFMIVGVNDDLGFDDSYRGFLEMAALDVGRSIAGARQRSGERERAHSIAALERARTALFSNASHELRTPLALVLGHLEQVVDEADLAEPARQSLEVAHRGAVRMLKLVNALLDFSRTEASERTGAFCLTDLGRLTTDVAAMFTATAARAGLALTVDCPPFSAPVYVDREAWERIVSNLLSNALKFTLEGRIDVRTRDEQGWAELAVADTGIGIMADDLDQVFSRFHRVGDPRARTQEGTGIGLALVRELVELHRGSVEARSQPGRGTEMIVRIPLAGERLCDRTPPEDAPSPLLGSSARLFIAEADGWLDGRTPAPAPDSLPAGLTTKPTAPRRRGDVDSVLVVEDNVDMQGYLRRLLGPHYTVQVAQDGRQGCELAVRHRPRLVISDVMMPGLDGLGLLRELRRNPRTREVPVMLVSALADAGSAEQAFRLGADDYIVKPFSARELLARVAAAIESAGVRSRAAAARGRAAERGRAQRELGAVLNDLRAAQRRAVIAADAERRRIERDLHDGAQQRLMAIRLELGLIVEALEHDREGARAKLGALRAELDEALEEVRELAHGLYPPLLASDGLYAALSAAARRAAIPIAIETTELARAPRAIESAAYFCCLEALQNAAKHAGAGARATVDLGLNGGCLEFRVSDDGAGFDPEAVRLGHGLTNLRDRLEALGGHAEIVSVPGEGTTVLGRIPIS